MFDRATILELFTELAGRLGRSGVKTNVYVVGGAAMALLYDDRRVTRDIDSVILDHHGPLTDAVRAIARERGLPSTWLNDQAAAYVATGVDRGRTNVFDHPNLTVAAASPDHLLAMKLNASRPSDVEDIRTLLELLGLDSLDAVESLRRRVFPDVDLSLRARIILEDLLADEQS